MTLHFTILTPFQLYFNLVHFATVMLPRSSLLPSRTLMMFSAILTQWSLLMYGDNPVVCMSGDNSVVCIYFSYDHDLNLYSILRLSRALILMPSMIFRSRSSRRLLLSRTFRSNSLRDYSEKGCSRSESLNHLRTTQEKEEAASITSHRIVPLLTVTFETKTGMSRTIKISGSHCTTVPRDIFSRARKASNTSNSR